MYKMQSYLPQLVDLAIFQFCCRQCHSIQFDVTEMWICVQAEPMQEDANEGFVLAEEPEDIQDENDAMDIDDSSGPQSPKSQKPQNAELKAEITKVLQYDGFESLRSAKLTQDHFLLLLSKFNEAGFHFA